MKKNYHFFTCLIITIFHATTVFAQCGSPVSGGSSSNVFTLIRNSTNPVAADKVLNTVVFIHRNNATAFGGNSGHLRYDVSYNAGATWTNNVGVLNPLTTNLGRYPNVAIYNPTNNTVPSNAYLGYMAATIDPTTSAWNGVVSGVSQLNSGSSTENYNQPVVSPQFIPHSVIKGAPGVYWAVDALFNGTNITGYTIYRGQWNNTSSSIVWANNFTVSPNFNTGLSSIPSVGDYNIAFDPTGTIGWFSFLAHLSPGPANYALYPVFYKTINGGTSWTGPFQVNLNNFSCMTGNMVSTNVITTNFEHDLTVDVNGNPHLLTTICNGSNAYGVFYNQWHHMYDITQKSGLWVAYDVANVLAGRGQWGTSPNIITQDMSPQVSRTADGTKVFFTWSDNTSYTLGQANISPNLFGRGYNVSSDTWTPIKDFSSCNSGIAGTIIVPHVAAEVLEPATNLFKLAPVYGLMTSNDPTLTANFNFLDNVSFSSSEFTVNPPASPTISIAQGTNVLLCPGSTITINVTGTVGQALWSTGATASGISISNPTITSYSVVAQQSCNVGTASISVTNMSISTAAPTSSVCEGSPATLSVSGNAVSYSWSPGNLTGTMVTITTSTSIPVYTVVASSNANCTMSSTVGVNIWSLPTVSITGNTTLCSNSVLTLTATGANSYTWSSGSISTTISVLPNTAIIICGGADANGCENFDTLNIQTLPVPTITAISDKTVICYGGMVNMTAVGANSYSWSTGSPSANTTASPTTTTIYTVTGYDANMCDDTETISVIVNQLPVIVISSTRPALCLGERAIISVTGANSYLWNGGQTSTSMQITPSVTTNYTVTGTDLNSCVNTSTFSQVVNPCTGIDKTTNTSQLLTLFPNPSKGEFYIHSEEKVDAVIVNAIGQTVSVIHLDKADNFKAKLTLAVPGIYFVVYSNSGKQVSQKLIIEN